MNAYYLLKRWLKIRRWQLRRLKVELQWGPAQLNQTPALVGNAMPKSGSHLIIQVLQGLTTIGPFVNPGFPPLTRAEDNSPLPDEKVLQNIQALRTGDISYGYIHAREPFVSALTAPGKCSLFVYRDPRDMIVSQVFYATQIHPDHGMHYHYTQVLSSMEERINAAIMGVNTEMSQLSGVVDKYKHYIGWLDQPKVLPLRFEDLIIDRNHTLNRILDYISANGFTPRVSRIEAIEKLAGAIKPKKSGTFRRGQPGNWTEYFSSVNKKIFKDVTGSLLIDLGYELNNDW